jgi:hypothetical protein
MKYSAKAAYPKPLMRKTTKERFIQTKSLTDATSGEGFFYIYKF